MLDLWIGSQDAYYQRDVVSGDLRDPGLWRSLAADIDLISNAGHSADLSGPVMTRALCHFDNAYWLPHVAMRGYCARTNTQSNTAFRGFGGPQGAIAIEYLLDSVARKLGKDVKMLREVEGT